MQRSTWSALVRCLVLPLSVGMLFAGLCGCSLISLKSPEKPLSTRDLNTRILTREYSSRFIAAVAQAADEIAAGTQDPSTRLNALRWKIVAAAKAERAASQMAPLLSLLDTWAFADQMAAYLTDGAGRDLFGAAQPRAAGLAADLQKEAQDLARQILAPADYESDRRFIEGYVQAQPITSLHFARGSIVEAWSQYGGTQTKLVDTLGTVPEALSDAGDRLRMYGETGPEQLLWQAQLAAQESGMSSEDFRAALRRLDERMSEVSVMVNSTPRVVNGMVRDAGTRFDASWAQVLRDIRAEEQTLAGTVDAERQAAMTALDAERASAAADASRIAGQVVRDTGEEVRRLVRQALILVIVLAIVALGGPFAAGYLVGRAHRRK